MMKKLILSLALSLLGATAVFAEAKCGFWYDAPEGIGSKSVKGAAFGIPVGDFKNVDGAQISILGSQAQKVKGFQGSIVLNKMAVHRGGCQFGIVNFVTDSIEKKGAQVGFYNQSARGGIQVGFVNNGRDNSWLQVGLVNINEDGLFPVMIFVNFDKDFFD